MEYVLVDKIAGELIEFELERGFKEEIKDRLSNYKNCNIDYRAKMENKTCTIFRHWADEDVQVDKMAEAERDYKYMKEAY